MLESTGSSKPRDALLEKLRERIKDRDRALEVKHKHTVIKRGVTEMNGSVLGLIRPQKALYTEHHPSQPLFCVDSCTINWASHVTVFPRIKTFSSENGKVCILKL